MKMKFKFLNNHRGFSLPEVMISLTIISIAIYGYLEVRQRVAERERQFTSDLTFMKLLLSLKDQVLADNEFIAPLSTRDDNFWADEDKSGIRCYDRQGALIDSADYLAMLEAKTASDYRTTVTDDFLKNHPKIDLLQTNICPYFLSFYKTGLTVSGVKAPIAQYHMRLAYFVGNKGKERLKVYTFRPLKTQVFYY